MTKTTKSTPGVDQIRNPGSIKKGFTLIEVLVVLSIIGILIAISIFSLQSARSSSRDARRQADLELIRAGLEIYKADCADYPSALPIPGGALVGDGSPTTCASTNKYIEVMPKDALNPTRVYYYNRLTGTTYELCAALENGGALACTGGINNCGTNIACNYQTKNP